MTIKEAYIQIDKYLDSDKHGPIVVDVADGKSMIYLIRKYNVGGSNLFISACDFCKGDNMPLNHKLKNAVSTSQCNLFLTDYSTYLKLLGEGELQLQIKSLLTDTIIDGKLIIFTSSCHKYLMQFDRRLIDSRRIIFVGENIDSVKRIFFIDSKLPIKFDRLDVSDRKSVV